MEYESEKNMENLVRELSYPLYKGKSWLKFYGIITIITGVLAALSIVGILYAWLPVWLGVLVNGAANKVEMAYHTGNKQALIEAQQKLNTFFVINSVIMLITILISIFIIVVFFSLGVFNEVINNNGDFY